MRRLYVRGIMDSNPDLYVHVVPSEAPSSRREAVLLDGWVSQEVQNNNDTVS